MTNAPDTDHATKTRSRLDMIIVSAVWGGATTEQREGLVAQHTAIMDHTDALQRERDDARAELERVRTDINTGRKQDHYAAIASHVAAMRRTPYRDTVNLQAHEDAVAAHLGLMAIELAAERARVIRFRVEYLALGPLVPRYIRQASRRHFLPGDLPDDEGEVAT